MSDGAFRPHGDAARRTGASPRHRRRSTPRSDQIVAEVALDAGDLRPVLAGLDTGGLHEHRARYPRRDAAPGRAASSWPAAKVTGHRPRERGDLRPVRRHAPLGAGASDERRALAPHRDADPGRARPRRRRHDRRHRGPRRRGGLRPVLGGLGAGGIHGHRAPGPHRDAAPRRARPRRRRRARRNLRHGRRARERGDLRPVRAGVDPDPADEHRAERSQRDAARGRARPRRRRRGQRRRRARRRPSPTTPPRRAGRRSAA